MHVAAVRGVLPRQLEACGAEARTSVLRCCCGSGKALRTRSVLRTQDLLEETDPQLRELLLLVQLLLPPQPPRRLY